MPICVVPEQPIYLGSSIRLESAGGGWENEGAGPVAGAAARRALGGELDPDGAGGVEARAQGGPRWHRGRDRGSSWLCPNGEGPRPVDSAAEDRPRQGRPDPRSVPDRTLEDGCRSERTATLRASCLVSTLSMTGLGSGPRCSWVRVEGDRVGWRQLWTTLWKGSWLAPLPNVAFSADGDSLGQAVLRTWRGFEWRVPWRVPRKARGGLERGSTPSNGGWRARQARRAVCLAPTPPVHHPKPAGNPTAPPAASPPPPPAALSPSTDRHHRPPQTPPNPAKPPHQAEQPTHTKANKPTRPSHPGRAHDQQPSHAPTQDAAPTCGWPKPRGSASQARLPAPLEGRQEKRASRKQRAGGGRRVGRRGDS